MKRHTILTAIVAFTLGTTAGGYAGTAPEASPRSQALSAALDGISVERLPDRVRVFINGVGSAPTYQLEDSRIPPMVSVQLRDVESRPSGELQVDQQPLRRILRDQVSGPGNGTRLVFQLSEYVQPEIAQVSEGLQLDFPTKQSTAPAATKLTGIHVHAMNGETTVLVSANGRLEYEAHMASGNRLVVDLPGLATSLRTPIDAPESPLVKRVRLGRHADKLRLVVDLAGPSHYVVDTAAASMALRLSAVEDRLMGAVPEPEHPTYLTRMPVQGAAIPVAARALAPARTNKAFGLSVTPQRAQQLGEIQEKAPHGDEAVVDQAHYVGRRMSLDFQAADITNVLRLIAEVSGFNIVVGEGVKAKVTMKIVNVPWDQALDMLLKMNGLGMIKQGNIVWVDTLASIAKQQQDEANAKNSKMAAEELVTRIFYLRNVQAQEVLTSLRQYITSRGKMQANAGSNALIVRDVESKIGVIKQMIDGLDIQVPQVEIEARVVQANTNYTRALGIQWGFSNINQLGSSNGVANFRAGMLGPFGAPTSNFLVNLPATVAGLAPTPAVGFQFGKTDGAMLDLRLSAGEALGLTKVIASPKITTLDKRDAKISQGESIPFQTVSLQGTQTTFVDANLELQVTPQITSRDPNEVAKIIMMKVRATRNAVGARSNPAGPSIDKREATTQVLIRDGETMVIGGVYVDAQINGVIGVPYLSRIPVIGWLFKNKTEDIARQELLIFLTPNIVKS